MNCVSGFPVCGDKIWMVYLYQPRWLNFEEKTTPLFWKHFSLPQV